MVAVLHTRYRALARVFSRRKGHRYLFRRLHDWEIISYCVRTIADREAGETTFTTFVPSSSSEVMLKGVLDGEWFKYIQRSFPRSYLRPLSFKRRPVSRRCVGRQRPTWGWTWSGNKGWKILPMYGTDPPPEGTPNLPEYHESS